MEFRVGDIVRKKDGKSFSSGAKTAIVTELNKFGMKNQLGLNTGTHIEASSLVLAENREVTKEEKEIKYLKDQLNSRIRDNNTLHDLIRGLEEDYLTTKKERDQLQGENKVVIEENANLRKELDFAKRIIEKLV